MPELCSMGICPQQFADLFDNKTKAFLSPFPPVHFVWKWCREQVGLFPGNITGYTLPPEHSIFVGEFYNSLVFEFPRALLSQRARLHTGGPAGRGHQAPRE